MRWIACAFLAITSGSALAQDVSGAYVGATVGSLSYVEEADNSLTFSDIDESASAYRLYGGYRLGRRFALELGYAKSNGLSDAVDVDFGSIFQADFTGDFAITTGRVLMHFPVNAERLPFVSLSFFAGAGLFAADSTWKASASGQALIGFDETYEGSTALLGVQIDFPKVSVRGEYEWFDTDPGIELGTTGIGVIFRF